MRIVRTARSKGTIVKRIVECRSCGCEIEITSNDIKTLRLIPDSRDGDYYELTCLEPGCENLITIDASLLS